MGIPTISFKLPVRSWLPKCWMAIPEAWPDPNPTTMPLFTYVSTYQTTKHVYKIQSSLPITRTIIKHKKWGIWILTNTQFLTNIYTVNKTKKNSWHRHNRYWIEVNFFPPYMHAKTKRRKIWKKLKEHTVQTMGITNH